MTTWLFSVLKLLKYTRLARAFILTFTLFLPVTANAVDFGISVNERSVTTGQNSSSSGFQQLIIHRKDFDGPIEVDVAVNPDKSGVDARISSSSLRLLQGGNKRRSEADITIDTEKYAENGVYQVTVMATGTVNGEKRTRVATFNVIVKRRDTFSIAVKPEHVTLPQGSVVSTNVEISEFGAFKDRVYLEIHSERGKTLDGFGFNFSGANSGYKAAANRSDIVTGSQHWNVVPDSNNKSVSQLTITTYPDTVPGEYTFYVHGQRDAKKTVDRVVGGGNTAPTRVDSITTRRAILKVTVTADPAFIDLIEPVEFSITTEKTRMVTPPSGYPYMNEIYVTAERSLETIRYEVSLEPKAVGISVGQSGQSIKQGGANSLFVAVTEEAKPGTYYATITATSRGSNNKTKTVTTRVEIIVPDIKKALDSKVSMGDKPKLVKVNCVGSSCSNIPITGTCTGDNCPDLFTLNCGGNSCPEIIQLDCDGTTCPGEADFQCDANGCGIFVDGFESGDVSAWTGSPASTPVSGGGGATGTASTTTGTGGTPTGTGGTSTGTVGVEGEGDQATETAAESFACPVDSMTSTLSPVSTICPPPECSAEVVAVNQTIRVILELEARINSTITEFNSLCDDGDDPRDAPPPTVYGEEIDPDASYCGPDVTAAMMAAMARVHRRMKKLPDNEKGIIDAADPLFTESFLMRNATNMDQKPLLPQGGICPSGVCAKDGNTVKQPCYTFFGKCVPEHVLNDIIFGFASDQLYTPEIVQAIGGAWHQYNQYKSWEPATSREAYDFGDEVSEDFDAGEVPTPDTVQDDLKNLMEDVVSDYPWIKDCKACPDPTPLSEWKGDFSRRSWTLSDGRYLNEDGTITREAKESEKEQAKAEQERIDARLGEIRAKLTREMAQHKRLMDILERQRADLSRCEDNCRESSGGFDDSISIGGTSIGAINDALSQLPGSITTSCTPCQSIAGEYNEKVDEIEDLLEDLKGAINNQRRSQEKFDRAALAVAGYDTASEETDPESGDKSITVNLPGQGGSRFNQVAFDSVSAFNIAREEAQARRDQAQAHMIEKAAIVARLSSERDTAYQVLAGITVRLVQCELRCAAVRVLNVISLGGNNPYDRQDPLSGNSNSVGTIGTIGTIGTPGATVKVINNIPISRLSLLGPDACSYNHYHGSANNCNGVFTPDPAPGVCGQGIVMNVTTIPVTSCPDL